ncbi:hypothetical protein K443DRAFT_674210 [Laccaria amethystina LaAM-08-1]|jgi:hypothetical protein|uniref:Uncharacterized protein n=1 Tax=Laccaria amethystina LaAM-08-1 TaxID=1095629 RepID=A0A0C9Y8M4_9AGAR|nr:hypothetical protein K443DRAFT_674210 [Laccaria amethystina LaAM-08-1]
MVGDGDGTVLFRWCSLVSQMQIDTSVKEGEGREKKKSSSQRWVEESGGGSRTGTMYKPASVAVKWKSGQVAGI